MQVIIAGGGVGGLCLAQGLHRAGVRTTVLERDGSAALRAQGYRIHIDDTGDAALRACLPEPLYRLCLDTSNRPGTGRISVLDHRFRELFGTDPAAGEPVHTAVNRLTLRQILLHGLPDVRFGQAVSGYEQRPDGVLVRCADGTELTGDVLVGADGAGSAVRRQLLPAARVTDTQLRCVYGRTALAGADVPDRLLDGFTGVRDRKGHSMALGAFRARRAPAEAAAELASGPVLDAVPDYLMWAVVARGKDFAGSDEELWSCDGAALHELALRLIRRWHPVLRGLLTSADPASCFPVAIRSAEPVDAWPPGRVTVLGDAIHVMTPAGGVGANTALRDAARLTAALAAVDRGERPLAEAVGEYEADLREHGFAAVRASMENATRALIRAG
jgi:salicylate hydroxylase